MKIVFNNESPLQTAFRSPINLEAEICELMTEKGTSYASQRRLRQMNQATDAACLRHCLNQPQVYTIEATPRPGNPHRIVISIANVSHLKLSEETLSEIFRLANQYTLNKPYPLGDWPMRIGPETAYRPNHNGTHSARQTASMEALFDLLLKKGDQNKKNLFNSLTDEEKLNLRLAAYFLRSGRVDESKITDPPADNYNARSALIYENYAKQLGVSTKTVEWIKKLIFNSCKPKGVRERDIDSDPKNKLGYTLLSLVHELDLIRCYTPEKMKDPMEKIKKHLGYFITDHPKGANTNQYLEQLIQYSKELCQVTGCSRVYDKDRGNRNTFMICSNDGAFAWKVVKSVLIPKWK